MPQLLIVLGAVLVLAGLAGIAGGAPSWALGLGLGSTLIQSGTIGFVGGLILIAIALVLRALQDLLGRLEMIGPSLNKSAPADSTASEYAAPLARPKPRPSPPPPPQSESADFIFEDAPPRRARQPEAAPLGEDWRRENASASIPTATVQHRNPRPRRPSVVTEKNPSGAAVVRSGIIGGMAYTLYSDGSIEAELPIGTVRFGSLAELQEHVMRTGAEADAEFTGPTQ